MEVLRIENSKIEKTNFNHIDKLAYVIKSDSTFGFRLETTRASFNLKAYAGLDAIYAIFCKLIGDVKRAENEKYADENKDWFIVVKNDRSLSEIAKQIITQPLYEDIYGTMSEGDLIDSILEAKAQFVARFIREDDGFFCYEIVVRSLLIDEK